MGVVILGSGCKLFWLRAYVKQLQPSFDRLQRQRDKRLHCVHGCHPFAVGTHRDHDLLHVAWRCISRHTARKLLSWQLLAVLSGCAGAHHLLLRPLGDHHANLWRVPSGSCLWRMLDAGDGASIRHSHCGARQWLLRVHPRAVSGRLFFWRPARHALQQLCVHWHLVCVKPCSECMAAAVSEWH